jgi:hypothetical protein
MDVETFLDFARGNNNCYSRIDSLRRQFGVALVRIYAKSGNIEVPMKRQRYAARKSTVTQPRR